MNLLFLVFYFIYLSFIIYYLCAMSLRYSLLFALCVIC